MGSEMCIRDSTRTHLHLASPAKEQLAIDCSRGFGRCIWPGVVVTVVYAVRVQQCSRSRSLSAGDIAERGLDCILRMNSGVSDNGGEIAR